MDEENNEKLTEIDPDMLQSNPLQPRGIITSDSLEELAASIKEQGILEPIVVSSTPAGYQIIAGERRWRAAKILGLKSVPVVIKKSSPQQMLEMAIVENVQREDLNPIERAQAYKRLIDEFGLGTNEVARKVGKSAPTVSNTIRLLTLPDAIKDALVAGVITEGHVRPLISVGDNKLMLELFKKILKENSTVRETEEMARKAKGDVERREPKKKDKLWVPELEEMAKNVQDKVEADKVEIFQSRSKVRIIIEKKGDVDVTGPKVQQIVGLLTGRTKDEDLSPQQQSV
jgi:ParB family chromosome partitioning protein